MNTVSNLETFSGGCANFQNVCCNIQQLALGMKQHCVRDTTCVSIVMERMRQRELTVSAFVVGDDEDEEHCVRNKVTIAMRTSLNDVHAAKDVRCPTFCT